jgi:hypothetical protein
MTTSDNQRTRENFPEQAEPAVGRAAGASSALSTAALAEQCLLQLEAYRRGEACDESYGLELFRRATVEGDVEAWEGVQRCFGELVRAWLRGHPSRAVACRLESEANYVALAFERFWQATSLSQQVTFKTLAAALHYLRASLHGAILDTLRTYARPKEVPLSEPGEPGEPFAEDQMEASELWEVLEAMLPSRREQRLAYLLYSCGLKPREIVRFCPQEWSDVREIYQLRRTIIERVRHHASQLRWRLSAEEAL